MVPAWTRTPDPPRRDGSEYDVESGRYRAAALAAPILAGVLLGYRYTHYGQANAQHTGDAAMVDRKPAEACKPRPH